MSMYSVIIPWRDRPELKQALEANAPMFERHAAEVIVVNGGGDPDAVTTLIRDVPITALRQIVFPDAPFNLSRLRNLGAQHATGRFLFFLDADTIMRTDVLSQSRAVLEGQAHVVTIKRALESRPSPIGVMAGVKELIETRDLRFADGKKARLRVYKRADGSRVATGSLLVSASHFMSVGGYDSALEGWGFEDTDLLIRLQAVLGLKVRELGVTLHLTHDDTTRAIKSNSRQTDVQRNLEYCFANYSRGVFAGSYERDVHDWLAVAREAPCGAVAAS